MSTFLSAQKMNFFLEHFSESFFPHFLVFATFLSICLFYSPTPMMECGFKGNPIPRACDRKGGGDDVIHIIGSECPALGKIAMAWWKGRPSEIQHTANTRTILCCTCVCHQSIYTFLSSQKIMTLYKSVEAWIKYSSMLWWNDERHSRSRQGLKAIGFELLVLWLK